MWENRCDTRNACMITVQKAAKGIKRRCVSVIGVKLCNNINIHSKMCNSLMGFKTMVCKGIFEGYTHYYYYLNLDFACFNVFVGRKKTCIIIIINICV